MSRKIWLIAVLALVFLGLTWGMTIPAISQRIPGWAYVIASVSVLVITSFLGSSINEEVKDLLRSFDAWRHNSPYVYSINTRVNLPAEFGTREIFDEVKKILKQEGIVYKDAFSNSNNIIVELDHPPISMRVLVTPEEGNEDDFEDETPQNVVQISSTGAEVIRYQDRNSQHVQKVINVFHDVSKALANKFNGESPEILMTINRLKNIDSARRIVAPQKIIKQTINSGTKVVKASNALQIITRNKNSIIDQMKEDISYLEPLG